MKLHQKTLSSGLRLQAVEMPGTNVVTTLILVGAGSRYETHENTGLSHFLEHMFFKGAKKYQTPKAVAESVDSFGGEFNAFTGKEYAGYYVKSGKGNLDSALEVLSDMLLHARFPAEEIEKERGVEGLCSPSSGRGWRARPKRGELSVAQCRQIRYFLII